MDGPPGNSNSQRSDFRTGRGRDGGGLVLLGVTGGPVRIGEGRKPLASSQTLSENSQMASGAVSATGSRERMPQAPNSTPITARRANGPPMRPIITSGRGSSLDRHIK